MIFQYHYILVLVHVFIWEKATKDRGIEKSSLHRGNILQLSSSRVKAKTQKFAYGALNFLLSVHPARLKLCSARFIEKFQRLIYPTS